jgi:hypothetical protein
MFGYLSMTPASNSSSDTLGKGQLHEANSTDYYSPEGIDLRQVFARLCRGLTPTIGFSALGLVLAIVVHLLASPFVATTTSMRIAFAFGGYAKGEYPDHSKFQPEDVLAPDIIAEALKHQGLANNEEFASGIRAGLTVEGLIPPNIIKERDRLRAGGQNPGPYLPDEYLITLTLPRKFPLNRQQRELLLNGIVSGYHEKFTRTYAAIPLAFGSGFESLHGADYYEYEMVLGTEMRNIKNYLNQELDQAKNFRSPTTNLSFNDLIEQTETFSQIRLFETLGLIRQNGLSKDRTLALMKMDYYLLALNNQEQKAIEEEKVVDDLLAKSQERSQNYVLGIKSQVGQQRPEAPILDQGLIDSLLANDASNFLVHQALSAGLKVKDIQAEKAQLLERRKNMEFFINQSSVNQTALIDTVQKSLENLKISYTELISAIRKTHEDFAKQQFADAIRISMQPQTDSFYRSLAVPGIVGAFIGLALGMGLSLLGIYIGSTKP